MLGTHTCSHTYFYQRIVQQGWRYDLEAVNVDGRDLYSIAGLAHDKHDKKLRKYANPQIKAMVEHLCGLSIRGVRRMAPAGAMSEAGTIGYVSNHSATYVSFFIRGWFHFVAGVRSPFLPPGGSLSHASL